MATKKSLVEVTHDDGYGDSLLMHINSAFGGKDMRADKIVDPVASAMQIEGIPDGWELVRVGTPRPGEHVLGKYGKILHCNGVFKGISYVIIRKKEKRYRPFANAAEFEPHRDRWVLRSDKSDTEATRPEGCFRVAAYSDHHFWTIKGEAVSYEEAFKDGKRFEDGTPFGVEVVE